MKQKLKFYFSAVSPSPRSTLKSTYLFFPSKSLLSATLGRLAHCQFDKSRVVILVFFTVQFFKSNPE